MRIAFDPEPPAPPPAGTASPADAARAKAVADAVAKATHYPLERVLTLTKGQVVRIELDEGKRDWVVR